jgi:hypothetical protein
MQELFKILFNLLKFNNKNNTSASLLLFAQAGTPVASKFLAT